MGMTFEDLKNVVASLHEFNPMMVTVAAIWLLPIPRSLLDPRCDQGCPERPLRPAT